MIVIGLTGSIGMGKSTTARLFEEAGARVWDADRAVHRLYSPGGAAVAPIQDAFPDAIQDGAVDRNSLGRLIAADPSVLKTLESLVHPLVARDRLDTMAHAKADGVRFMVLDIPLLFETGGETAADVVVVVSAPPEVQRKRVLARPGMTEDKFEAIVARQLPDAEKRRRADYIVDTSQGEEAARRQVHEILADLAMPDAENT